MKNNKIYFIFLFTVLFAACSNDYTPKPMGYMRVDFPEKKYQKYESDCPFQFEYPVYANVVPDKSANAEPHWINIDFPKFRGKIHISYKNVNNDVAKYLEDSRTLAYKHSIKADAINENLQINKEKKVYGIIYDIKGNAASSIQFFLTDSTRHFIRGALYFNVEPNKDSLAPVVNFIHKDIEHMIKTFEWK